MSEAADPALAPRHRSRAGSRVAVILSLVAAAVFVPFGPTVGEAEAIEFVGDSFVLVGDLPSTVPITTMSFNLESELIGFFFEPVGADPANDPPTTQPVDEVVAEISILQSSIDIPALTPPGEYRVFACVLVEDNSGQCQTQGGQIFSSTFGLFSIRGIVVDPGSGAAGSAATITGGGFAATDANGEPICDPVEFDFGGTDIGSQPISVPGFPFLDRGFSYDFQVPDRPPGTYTITASQEGSNPDLCELRTYTTTFTIPAIPPPVQPPPQPPTGLSVTPDNGLAGSSTTATALNFGDSGECGPVAFTFDGASVGTSNTSSTGVGFFDTEASLTFTVPDLPPGPYTVIATQSGCGDLDASATFTVTPPEVDLEPVLLLDPEEGTIETEVEATGEGFEPGVAVEIRIGDEQIPVVDISATDVDDLGAFTVTFEVPEGVPGGLQEVLACQRCDGADEVFAIAIFEVLPRIFLDRELAAGGGVVQVTGDGFPIDVPVEFSWDRGIGLETTSGDELGELELTMLIFRRDLLGPRELIAEVIDPTLEEDDEPTVVTEEFLVVPGTIGPPDFASRR